MQQMKNKSVSVHATRKKVMKGMIVVHKEVSEPNIFLVEEEYSIYHIFVAII